MDSNGKGLNVLILCEYSVHHDWQTFACWYSIYKNLPEAQVFILCARKDPNGFAPFNWITRAKVSFFQCKYSFFHEKISAFNLALQEHFVKCPCLVIPCQYMCIRPLSKLTLSTIKKTKYYENNDIFLINSSLPIENNVNQSIPYLANNADDDTSASFTNFSKIGEFNLIDWENRYTINPFHNINNISYPMISSNGRKILELWNKMKTIYEVIK